MAAPLGFKTFNTGDVLSAADTNGYLMQGIWVFADATARDAAVTSPQEGNSCYLKDTDVIQVYSGSSWVVKSGGSSPLTTKGDLYTYSTTDTRLPVGTNGHTLVADSSTATGLKWAAAASGGGFTLLDTKTFDNSVTNYTFTSISGSYKHLYVIGEGMQSNATSGTSTGFNVELNGDSAGNYFNSRLTCVATTVTGSSEDGNTKFAVGNCLNDTNDTNGFGSLEMIFYNYAETTNYKSVYCRNFACVNTASGSTTGNWLNGTYNSTSAITSIKFTNTGAVNLKSGTLKLYGVS